VPVKNKKFSDEIFPGFCAKTNIFNSKTFCFAPEQQCFSLKTFVFDTEQQCFDSKQQCFAAK
jgi:hypothetical protein